MIRVGQREFAIPLWLWAAVPFGFVLYTCIDLYLASGSRPIGSLRFFLETDRTFLTVIAQLAAAALAGLFLVDLARRSRSPWYGLPLLWLAGSAGAFFVTWDVVAAALERAALNGIGLALAVAPTGIPRSGAIGMLIGFLLVPTCLALLVALLLTTASRTLTGQSLLTRDALRECWVTMLGVFIWLLIALGGYLAIRSIYGSGIGSTRVPQWLLLLWATAGALIATALYLYLAHRARRQMAPAGDLRVWLVAVLAVVSFVYRPDLLGTVGWRISIDYVRPALRAAHLLPTPDLKVGGYRISVPYTELKMQLGSVQSDGGRSYIAFRLPADYGVTTQSHSPHLNIVRRSAPLVQVASYWEQRRKELDVLQAANPGRDVIVRPPGQTSLSLRLTAYPELELNIAGFDPTISPDAVEQALRRFLQERLRRIN